MVANPDGDIPGIQKMRNIERMGVVEGQGNNRTLMRRIPNQTNACHPAQPTLQALPQVCFV